MQSEEWKKIVNCVNGHITDPEKQFKFRDDLKRSITNLYKHDNGLDEITLDELSKGGYEGIGEDITKAFHKGHDLQLAKLERSLQLDKEANETCQRAATSTTNTPAVNSLLEEYARNPNAKYADIKDRIDTHLRQIFADDIKQVETFVTHGVALNGHQQQMDTAAATLKEFKTSLPALEEDCIGKIAGAIRRSKLRVPGGEGAIVAAGALAAGAAALGVHALLASNKKPSHLEKLEAERQNAATQAHTPS